MGAYYTNGATRQDIIDECLEERQNLTILDHALTGNELWVAFERKEDKVRFIALFLLLSHRVGWGYKPMDETEGPYYYGCPLRFLDLVPDPGGYATGWREKVRQFHAARKAS